MRPIDLTGARFGRLVVLKQSIGSGRGAYWLCECDCGTQKVIASSCLRSGKTKSCGCLHDELSAARMIQQNTTHAESHTRLYGIWSDMRKRCFNKHHWAYERYGGRGITVCSEWENYQTFAIWAKRNGYSDDLTLDRVDNNKSYTPKNCRWVDRKTQARNKSNNPKFTFNEKTLTLADWAEQMNMPYTTLYGRVHNYGWSIQKALTTPIRKGVVNTELRDYQWVLFEKTVQAMKSGCKRPLIVSPCG